MGQTEFNDIWQTQSDTAEAGGWYVHPFGQSGIIVQPSLIKADTQIVVVQPTGPTEFRRDAILRTEARSDWLILPLLLSLLLLTLSRAFHQRRFRQVFLAELSSNNMNIMLREGNILGEAVSLLLFSNFILVLGMLLFLTAGVNNVALMPVMLPPYLVYAIIFISLVLFIFIKVLGVQVTGVVFRTEPESSDYILNIFMFNYIIGVVTLPFVILAIYPGWENALYVAWGTVVLLFVVRVLRGMLIGFGNPKFSPYLFLLYLCTLEILPLLFLVKVLIYNKA